MLVERWWLILALECIMCIYSKPLQQKRRCFFQITESTKHNYRQNKKYTAAGSVSGSVQVCETTDCCVGYYRIINGTPKADILACDRIEKSCPDETCKAQTRINNQFLTCMCNTDLCNGNITWGKEQTSHPYSYFSVVFMKKAVKPLVGILLFMCFWIVAAQWRSCLKKKKKNLQSPSHDYHIRPSCSCQMTKTSEIDISQIELQQIVGRGHFATVFQGTYQGSVVAVKFLPAAYEHNFNTEKEIYELLLSKHTSIVNFLGAGRKPDDKSWFIVLQFAEYGSLHSFLSKQTTSWMFSLNLCQSLSQGLSYLHSDLLSHDLHKPPVAHRDLSSSNVLVKADGTCALCDFGCSTILRSCSEPYRRHNQNKNTKCIQLGTLHYMAPEILEGFVNLNESMFLMQGDVYALGLLLWEIWMCCYDLFEGGAAPQHLLPYELELGSNVTLESLMLYVSYMDKRPCIPEHWELLPQGAVLRELLEDCWDSDSEARLTSHSVVERITSLQSSYSL
ncbi:bone morphogenetic protein receptor type-2 [Haplochromis burtoni]|uniref:receptor protein serine/threonine kinase n=1 Tax=Haplochromis burtoni TaxID=8153 RepID=A0A3Q2V869_HAPBU|nr:bone morphogenetic protein receptor type-2 [Haplochromis burtoni]